MIVSIRQFCVPMASICLLCYSLSHLERIQKYARFTKAPAMKVLSLMPYYAMK